MKPNQHFKAEVELRHICDIKFKPIFNHSLLFTINLLVLKNLSLSLFPCGQITVQYQK